MKVTYVNKKEMKKNKYTLRKIAEDINSLFSSIGQHEPINIDEYFTGKGSKKAGTDFE